MYCWLLTRTEDSLGNHIAYGYRDDGGGGGPQRYLESVDYADYGDPSNPTYAVTVRVHYDETPRPDPFGNRRRGFELRTTCAPPRSPGDAGQQPRPAPTVTLAYQDQTTAGPSAVPSRC